MSEQISLCWTCHEPLDNTGQVWVQKEMQRVCTHLYHLGCAPSAVIGAEDGGHSLRPLRLPFVSRRRHEREVREREAEVQRQGEAVHELARTQAERDEWAARGESAVARVAELEQAVREHLDADMGHNRLRAILAGHRQDDGREQT